MAVSFARKQQVPGDTVERMDFGELVPHEQKILPLGRDAVDILSQHFSSLVPSLQKGPPDGNSPKLIERMESADVPQNFKLFG
ncbi:hypothetical protein M413DRAFT_27236 [Hebeloma cylindrosporum]|uniref:Uncharacterized protein n=1 Tax=Hebeloma cylindrosporum TaxID=76867 RepID=A0A0C2XXU9_HEBCY|nr:hypothetical protein M413DRAFT_27236 [Hebeloma cylindrosporum h7]